MNPFDSSEIKRAAIAGILEKAAQTIRRIDCSEDTIPGILKETNRLAGHILNDNLKE